MGRHLVGLRRLVNHPGPIILRLDWMGLKMSPKWLWESDIGSCRPGQQRREWDSSWRFYPYLSSWSRNYAGPLREEGSTRHLAQAQRSFHLSTSSLASISFKHRQRGPWRHANSWPQPLSSEGWPLEIRSICSFLYVGLVGVLLLINLGEEISILTGST